MQQYEFMTRIWGKAANIPNLLKLSTSNTKYIKDLINTTSADLQIQNYTFIRVFPDASFNIVTTTPKISSLCTLKDLWAQDPIFNPNHIIPIYDKLDYFSGEKKQQYELIIKNHGGIRPIVLEFDLGTCKDTHSFLLSKEIEHIEMPTLFLYLHRIILHFYENYKLEYKKRCSIHNFEKIYEHKDINNKFDPYQQLQKSYNLTSKNIEYIKPLALGMSASQISQLMCRSVRTVEKSIDSIKYRLKLSHKNEISFFLQLYYNAQVKQYLSLTETK